MHRQALENALTNILKMYYDNDYDEEDEKRSIATLAKNGQLPSREPDIELDSLGEEDENGHKRNIGSLARSGMMSGKRNMASVARQWQFSGGKRNIGSFMRSNMFPGGKRNIASVARTGFGKRNVGTLARDWALPKFTGSKYTDGNVFVNLNSFFLVYIIQIKMIDLLSFSAVCDLKTFSSIQGGFYSKYPGYLRNNFCWIFCIFRYINFREY